MTVGCEGRARIHRGTVFQLFERVQQNKISLLEAIKWNVVPLVHDRNEAPVALNHNF